MNVSLTPELEELVSEKVKSGLYNSASEVVREGLRLLREQDELRHLRLDALRRDVQIGLEQAEQGQVSLYASPAALAADVKAQGRAGLSSSASGASPEGSPGGTKNGTRGNGGAKTNDKENGKASGAKE